MKDEFIAHEDSGTWDIVTHPPVNTAISSKWVYYIKYNADGRHKSCLCTVRNNQKEGDDFNVNFSPVVQMSTVLSLLGLIAAKSWELHQMDINNAFLHRDFKEEVYMKLPPDFTHSNAPKFVVFESIFMV